MNKFLKKYLESLVKDEPKSLKDINWKRYVIDLIIILTILTIGFVLEKTGKISYQDSINNNLTTYSQEIP